MYKTHWWQRLCKGLNLTFSVLLKSAFKALRVGLNENLQRHRELWVTHISLSKFHLLWCIPQLSHNHTGHITIQAIDSVIVSLCGALSMPAAWRYEATSITVTASPLIVSSCCACGCVATAFLHPLNLQGVHQSLPFHNLAGDCACIDARRFSRAVSQGMAVIVCSRGIRSCFKKQYCPDSCLSLSRHWRSSFWSYRDCCGSQRCSPCCLKSSCFSGCWQTWVNAIIGTTIKHRDTVGWTGGVQKLQVCPTVLGLQIWKHHPT